VARDLDVADPRARAGVHLEHQDRARRVARIVDRHGLHVRPQVAVVGVELLLEDPCDFRRAADRRRRAEAARHRAPQQPFGEAGRAPELNPRDGAQRHEVVHDLDAVTRGARLDADVLEPAQAEQVRDRLPHLGHRQRPPAPGLDQFVEDGIVGRAPFDQQVDRRDGAADVGRGGRRRLRVDRLARRRHGRRQPEQKAGHRQKLRLTRKSTAKVWSPVCVSTQPSRSL
jgi:hypothetical protein